MYQSYPVLGFKVYWLMKGFGNLFQRHEQGESIVGFGIKYIIDYLFSFLFK